MFFKHDNYKTFSSNNFAYKAITEKHFIDHAGAERYLCKSDASEIPAAAIKSELESASGGKYTIDETSILYFNINNKFEYRMKYSPVDIRDGKFMIDDVEFYVVRPDENREDLSPVDRQAINSIYFNEFQSNTVGQNQVAKVNGNKFKLNDLDYVIEGNEISIDAATSEFSGDEKEWKCEIVDGRFQFDGIWYVLVKDGSNNYVSVGYADNKDNRLI